MDPLRLPDRFDTVVVVLLAVRLPVALMLAWAYDTNPAAPASNVSADSSEPTGHTDSRKLDYIIVGLLVIAVVYMAIEGHLLGGSGEARVDSAPAGAEKVGIEDAGTGVLPDSVAVIPFEV
jgi:hypothetical protein